MRFSKNQPHWGWFMKRLSKILHQQLRKLIRVLNHSIVPIITILFFICIFAAFIPRAQSNGNFPTKATVDRVSGKVKPGQGKSLIVGDVLTVAKTSSGTSVNSKSANWAHLKFWTNTTLVDPILQAGVDYNKDTNYTFPCSLDTGDATLAWGLRQTSPYGCERIVITTSGIPSSSTRIAQPQVRARVERVRDLTLINAYNLNGKLVIDVLVGAVTVESGNRRENVEAGNRYIVTGSGQDGTIEKIDVATVVQSGSIQIFLDPSTWSQDITPLIQQFRRALRLRTAPIPGPTEPPM